ncbi:MAG: hypothetical protein IKR09_08060 [Alphaproteobacteria bacterium]|nr:hypothetical protein [Alphaproteobacteria bacterium]
MRGGGLHETYFRQGGYSNDMLLAALRNKRYYEEYIFSDEAVRNTLDAIVNTKYMRDLMNQDIHRVKLYIKDDAPMPREEAETFNPFALLKRAFQSPEKRAEEDRKRKAERDEKRRKLLNVYGVKKVLPHDGQSEDGIGAKSLDFVVKNGFDIDFDAMKSVAGCVDMEQKKILLNSSITHEEQALSLINAACFIKQEMNGAGKTEEDKALRKADTLATQIRFIRTVSFPDPLLKAAFKWNGNDPALLEQYREIRCEHGEKTACSECIDAYLSQALPDKKPSPEKIAKICRNFDGTSYYTAQTKTDAAEKDKPQKQDAVSKGKMKALNPSFIDKMKRQGR